MRKIVVLSSELQQTTAFESDWYGENLSFRAGFSLWRHDDQLSFLFKSSGTAPRFDAFESHGECVEGLWERDVAELFLYDPASEVYQEFNLAPSGAWWSMGFSGYRERMEDYVQPECTVVGVRQMKDGWEAQLNIPLDGLLVDLKTARASVCGINYAGAEAVYLCTAPSEGDPDFHNIANHRALELCG